MADKGKNTLIDILNKSFAEQYEKRGLLTAPHTADHLLANGVIVLPCKVGDIVWNVCADDIVRPWKVKFRTYDDREGWWIFLDWEGEDRHAKCSGDYFREKYFLTKEEAEARLRETTLMKKLPTNSHEYPHRHRPTPTKH